MALTKETGAIVAGANTYVDDAEFTAYAAARAVTLPATSAEREVLLIKAKDYLERYDARFVGERVQRDQPLSWPRQYVTIQGWDWLSSEIPYHVKNAQLQLAVEVAEGVDHLNPTTNALPVVEKRVEGAVAVKYAAPTGGVPATTAYPSAALISVLLKKGGGVVR